MTEQKYLIRRAALADALESGSYTQITSRLISRIDPSCCCAEGVACHVAGLPVVDVNESDTFPHLAFQVTSWQGDPYAETHFIPNEALDYFGLQGTTLTHGAYRGQTLMSLNDDIGLSLAAIAAALREQPADWEGRL